MKLCCLVLGFGITAGFAASQANAAIRLPQVLSDHAVLQRKVPIHIWGWANPQATVTIKFHNQAADALADEAGEWSAWLQPEQAGGPYVLALSGDGELTRQDILVGDVWVASGQSNMEMPLKGWDSAPMKDSAKEVAAASHPKIRLLQVPKFGSSAPQTDVNATWKICTPDTAANFSAVAYFFGREISEKENVPVGLVDSTWGGTPAGAWLSMAAYGSNPGLAPVFAARAGFAAGEARRQELKVIEDKKAEEAKAAGQPEPKRTWHPDHMSWMPTGLYNGMIAPLTPYSIQGFIWYQGETDSNSDKYLAYRMVFPALIDDWRMQFAQGTLPFLFVQISSYHSPDEHWGVIRDAQRRTLNRSNTAMAVTLDIGEKNNIHPADKQTVGARLALSARALVYKEAINASSPLFHQVTSAPGGLRVWFDHAEGLTARGPVTGFEVAGEDHKFSAATASIQNGTITVTSSAIANPRYVRFCWASDAVSNVYNNAGLPLGTFTSEDFPLD